jgi:hypothetical protein
MKKELFKDALALKCLDILESEASEDQKLCKLVQLIDADIAQNGREIDGIPTFAAVIEERNNLAGLTTGQKLCQCVDIIEFYNFMVELDEGMPSQMPEIMAKAAEREPAIYDLLASRRLNLN